MSRAGRCGATGRSPGASAPPPPAPRPAPRRCRRGAEDEGGAAAPRAGLRGRSSPQPPHPQEAAVAELRQRRDRPPATSRPSQRKPGTRCQIAAKAAAPETSRPSGSRAWMRASAAAWSSPRARLARDIHPVQSLGAGLRLVEGDLARADRAAAVVEDGQRGVGCGQRSDPPRRGDRRGAARADHEAPGAQQRPARRAASAAAASSRWCTSSLWQVSSRRRSAPSSPVWPSRRSVRRSGGRRRSPPPRWWRRPRAGRTVPAGSPSGTRPPARSAAARCAGRARASPPAAAGARPRSPGVRWRRRGSPGRSPGPGCRDRSSPRRSPRHGRSGGRRAGRGCGPAAGQVDRRFGRERS